MLHPPWGGAKTTGMIFPRLPALLLALALVAGGRAQAAIAIVAPEQGRAVFALANEFSKGAPADQALAVRLLRDR